MEDQVLAGRSKKRRDVEAKRICSVSLTDEMIEWVWAKTNGQSFASVVRDVIREAMEREKNTGQ